MRSAIFHIRVNQNESLLIQDEAESRNMTISAFIRMAVLDYIEKNNKSAWYPADMDLCEIERMSNESSGN